MNLFKRLVDALWYPAGQPPTPRFDALQSLTGIRPRYPVAVETERDVGLRGQDYILQFFVSDSELRRTGLSRTEVAERLSVIGRSILGVPQLVGRDSLAYHTAPSPDLHEALGDVTQASPAAYPGAEVHTLGSAQATPAAQPDRGASSLARAVAAEYQTIRRQVLRDLRDRGVDLPQELLEEMIGARNAPVSAQAEPEPEPDLLATRAPLRAGPHYTNGGANTSSYPGGVTVEPSAAPNVNLNLLPRIHPKIVFRGPARAQESRDCLSIGPLGSANDWLSVTFQEPEPILTRGCFTGTLTEFLAEVDQKPEGSPDRNRYHLVAGLVRNLQAMRQGEREREREGSIASAPNIAGNVGTAANELTVEHLAALYHAVRSERHLRERDSGSAIAAEVASVLAARDAGYN